MTQDIKNLFTYNSSTGAKDQAVTASAASNSQLGFGSKDIGKGNPVRVYAIVTTDFATLTSLEIAIQESSDDGDSDAYADVISSGAIPLADLTAGDIVWEATLPAECEKYLQAYFTVAGSNATAGEILVGLSFK
ncbi:MAG: hypothetical protein K9M94_13040 [Spirochaetia bacterium]|nr:hypothetical protein [Spirochaetia bacterium]